MKKYLALFLVFALLVSCSLVGMQFTTSGATPADQYTVETSVKAQDGLLGGTVTTDAEQQIAKGESATVTASPFYGNGFKGWYEGATLVSTNLSYTFIPDDDITLEAVFDIKNLIDNGDAEAVVHHATLMSNFNNPSVPKMQENCYGTTSIVETSGLERTDASYGDYALKLTPSQTTGTGVVNKVKSLAHFKLNVKKNTDYIVRFSYKFDDDIADFKSNTYHTLYMSLAGLASNGKVQWDDTDNTFKWAFHSQREGIGNDTTSSKFKNTWSWGGSVGHDANAYVSKFINDNATSDATYWQEVYFIFNPLEDASIFQGGGDEGVACFNFGTHWDTTDFLVLDNFSISEATANDRTTVSATSGGSIATNAPRKDDNYYVYTVGARGSANVFTNRDTANVFYPAIYEKYVATPAAGCELVGWFNENDQCVSTELTAYLLATGEKYTAKFAKQLSAEGGGAITDNGDGTYTAHAYYGNKFLGWFDGTQTPYVHKTDDVTIPKEGHLGYVALFTSDNLIYDGDFEVNNNTAQVYTDYTDYDKTYKGTYSIVPTAIENSGPEYGNNALQLTPHQNQHAAKRKGLLNIPVNLEAGKTYIWKFNYAVLGNSYTAGKDYIYLSVDKAVNGSAVSWDGNLPYSYHIQLESTEGINQNNYAWGDNTSDSKLHYSMTSAIADINKWIEVYVIFTPQETALHHLTLGTADAQTNSYLIDNMSCSVAKTGVSDIVSVTAGEYGKVYSCRTDEPAYQTDAPRGTADIFANHVDTDNPYYPDMYVDFFAETETGYIFDGWYDANNQKVSSDTVLRVKQISDEKYTAKFIMDNNLYSATAEVEPTNGIYGGYIIGENAIDSISSGEERSFTAVPYTGNKFLGWYQGSTLVTKDETVTLTIRKDVALTAKFEVNNLFTDSSYENTALGESVLGNGLAWTSTSASAAASVVGNEAATGTKSIMVTAPNAPISTVLDVAANTKYFLSFNWKGVTDGATALEYVKVYAGGQLVAEMNTPVLANSQWQKVNLMAESGTATKLTVEIMYTSANSNLYFDDFVLFDAAAVPFKISASVANQNGVYGGYITSEKFFSVMGGTSVTVSAKPYQRNTFLGWYEGDTLLSTDEDYTFTAFGFYNIEAKFNINNLWPDAGYENTKPSVSLSENGDWTVDQKLHDLYDFDVTVTDKGTAYDGKQMLSALHRGNTFSTVISGLKANTDYFLTFQVRTHKNLQNCYFESAKLIGKNTGTVLGAGFGTANGGQWELISVPFNTGNNTEMTVELLYQAGEKECYFDDFALFESHNLGVYAAQGGSVNTTASGAVLSGTQVTVTATPDSGNTFLGWYDYMDSSVRLSTANPYTFSVNKTQHVIAKFAGPDIEPENKIVDGDFENGAFEGFIFSGSTETANIAFCNYQVTKAAGGITPVSGDYMAKIVANSRTSTLLVRNLKPYTDYTVSFWCYGGEFIQFEWAAAHRYRAEYEGFVNQTTKQNIQNVTLRNQHTDVLAQNTGMASMGFPGDGKTWRKVEYTFNSQNRTEAFVGFSYTRYGGVDGIYVDDMKVIERNRYSDTVENGDFSNTTKTDKGWHGEYTIAADGGNNAGVSSGTIFNGVNLEKTRAYTLSFKAKSAAGAELLYGVAAGGYEKLYDGGKFVDLASTAAIDKATLTNDWETYEVTFLNGARAQGNVVLQSLNGAEFMVDDVVIKPATELAAAHKLGFEELEYRDIFNAAYRTTLGGDHKDQKNPEWYEISNAEAKTGDWSLLMKHKPEYVSHELSQPWATAKLEAGKTYEVSFYAKAATAGTKFMTAVYRSDAVYVVSALAEKEYELKDTEWHKFSYIFTTDNIIKTGYNRVSFVVNGIEGETTCDIYFDDIVIKESTSSINNADADKLYTEDLSQNYFSDYSFEKNEAAFAPFVKSGDASFGSKYITLNAGDKIIVPVKTRTDYNITWEANYTFAADVRGNAQSKGTVGLSYTPDGKSLFTDKEGNVVSLNLNTGGKWARDGFTFDGNRIETEYLVIECTAGSFDVDYLALFNTNHAFAECTFDDSVGLSKDELPVVDMGKNEVTNSVVGMLRGLPEGSKVVLEGKGVTYTADVVENKYRIDGIKEGTYNMYIAPGGHSIRTLYGELEVGTGRLSGVAVTRLDGRVIELSYRAVSDGIVKITDTETGYSYLTATDNDGYYKAYIVDCDWSIKGSTNDEAALTEAGLTLEQFGAKKAAADTGADIEDEEPTDDEEPADKDDEGTTVIEKVKVPGKKADNTIPYILFGLAGVIAVLAVIVLIVINRKKGVRD
ncbi:MAG: InlB B-repeat-containing protein [Clostridia bacterium]|nr:InlB B-repeat-containing protein [Clostridia bacterium]